MNGTPAIKGSRNPNIKLTTKVKSTNNQNSDLDARPEKLVYFTKQVLTASKKFISVSPSHCKSTDPHTSKKHGKGLADGGGQVFHTGKSDREYSEWIERIEFGLFQTPYPADLDPLDRTLRHLSGYLFNQT